MRLRAAELLEIEFRDQRREVEPWLDRIRGAELREHAVDGHGLDAGLAQGREAQALHPLRERLAAFARDQREMREVRYRGAERLEDLDLEGGVGDVVLAPDHMGD